VSVRFRFRRRDLDELGVLSAESLRSLARASAYWRLNSDPNGG
jgi:hypothetical protein